MPKVIRKGYDSGTSNNYWIVRGWVDDSRPARNRFRRIPFRGRLYVNETRDGTYFTVSVMKDD